MASRQLSTVLWHLCRIAGSGSADNLSDRQLLHRFAHLRDENAFAALVRRHAALVFGACRRILPRTQDAEDVFQATFLVLAHKAASTRWRESIGDWLHEVAHRLAMKARAEAARRQIHERQAAEMRRREAKTEESWQELCAVLDQMLRSLPERYRQPLLLCYLEGQTRDQAARQLGWSVRTLHRRLERGLKLLRARLTARGLTLPAALVAAGLSQQTASAGVSTVLLQNTVRAALGLATNSTGGLTAATALAEGLINSMKIVKVKITLALLLACSVIAVGAGVVTHQVFAEKHPADRAETQTRSASHGPEQAKSEKRQAAHQDQFGDPLPPGALARMGTVRFRHGNTIEAISLSADGRVLAAASRDQTVRLWDTATGRELRRFPGHEGSLRFVAFSPDGKMLATGVSPGGVVFLWDLATGKQLRRLRSKELSWLGHVAFSRDGKIVAAAANRHRVVLWETATGRVLHQLDGGDEKLTFAVPIAFAPDGWMLASGGMGEAIRLWNLKTGKEERRLFPQTPWPKEKTGLPFYAGLVRAVVFSPDGRILASAAQDSPVRLWDVASGKEIRCLRGDRFGAFTLAFSPNGKMLASGEMGTVRMWETATGKEVRRIPVHRGWVSGLAFVHDGATLVTSADSAIHLWEVRTGAEILPDRGHSGGIASSVLLPDGRTLVTGSSDNTIRWWNLATGKELHRLAGLTKSPYSMKAMVLSPNGTIAACYTEKMVGDREAQVGIELWDLTSRKKLALLCRPNIFAARFSPDSKTLFTEVWDVKQRAGFIISWDAATGKELRVLARGENVFGNLSLSADGTILAATGQWAGKPHFLWNVATGRELARIAGDPYFNQCLAISPDNKLLAVADDVPPQAAGNVPPHYIRLWDIATGKQVRRFGRSSGGYCAVAFSADGRTLATAGEDKQIRLWETATGGERLHLTGHAGQVESLLFAENGRRLISTSSDTTALVWDLTFAPGRDRKPLSADERASCWSDLRHQEAHRAYAAQRRLLANPAHAVADLDQRMRPILSVEERWLAQTIAELDSEQFAVREKAMAALLSKIDLAESALRRELAGRPALELRRRVETLLEQLDVARSPERLRQVRAVEVLEAIGTPDARHLLQRLAEGASVALQTREARASLGRMRRSSTGKP